MSSMNRLWYITVSLLSAQSIRYQNASKRNVEHMAVSASRSSLLHLASANDTLLSFEEDQNANRDAKLAENWTHRADNALKDAKEVEDSASKEAMAAEALETKSKAENLESKAASHRAAGDAAIAEAEEKEAAEAWQHAKDLLSDEKKVTEIVAACHSIPGVRGVCSAVGGVVDVVIDIEAMIEMIETVLHSMEVWTFGDKMKQANLERAKEFNASSTADAQVAANLEADAELENALAEKLRTDAKVDQDKAEALANKSQQEKATAAKEERKANEEQAQAEAAAADSTAHGVHAFWDATLATILAAISFLYFIFQVITQAILPGWSLLWNSLFSAHPASAENATTTFRVPRAVIAWALCRGFLHIFAFVSTVATFSNRWILMETSHDTSFRGECILLFALIGASADSLASFAAPHFCSTTHMTSGEAFFTLWGTTLLVFFLHVLVLFPLFILESLILWVNFGLTFLHAAWLSVLPPWVWWLSYVAISSVFVLLSDDHSRGAIQQNEQSIMTFTQDDDDVSRREDQFANEKQALLSENSDDDIPAEVLTTVRERPSSTFSLIRRRIRSLVISFQYLRLPFEILILSCMVRILWSCPSIAWKLFHVFSDDIFMPEFPIWTLVSGTLAMFVFFLAWIVTQKKTTTSGNQTTVLRRREHMESTSIMTSSSSLSSSVVEDVEERHVF